MTKKKPTEIERRLAVLEQAAAALLTNRVEVAGLLTTEYRLQAQEQTLQKEREALNARWLRFKELQGGVGPFMAFLARQVAHKGKE